MRLASITNSQQNTQQSAWEPSPPPAPGEVIVRVQACGLNHADDGTGATSHPSAQGAPFSCAMAAAGTVIAAGDGVSRFAVGDEVFGHFPAESCAWFEAPYARITADGPHVERRPDGLAPLAAVALAESGLIAKTILRAADLRPGQTAVVIGATSRAGTVLVPLLAEAGARVIAYPSAARVADALASHPDAHLLVDLVSLGEPYFIRAGARGGAILTANPGADTPGIPRIAIAAEPGDLAAFARRELDRRPPVELADVA